MEYFHPFDSKKFKRIIEGLIRSRTIMADQIQRPEGPVDMETLLLGHSQKYLDSLKDSKYLAEICGMPVFRFLPWQMIHAKVLLPMRHCVQGTLMAIEGALKYGWAINIGGGYHHASRERGEGFCVFDDISVGVHWARHKKLLDPGRVLIIDLDAHQGNGHEHDFVDDPNVKIIDVFNEDIYPQDWAAMRGCDYPVRLETGVSEKEYLGQLSQVLRDFEQREKDFRPQLIFYNAGTDILRGDPLGLMKVSGNGVVIRDQKVFEFARRLKAPVVMVLSGGYQKNNAPLIARSIRNLKKELELF